MTFSVPVINELYFLRSSVFGGTRFGVLGYCIESPRLSCSSLRYAPSSWDFVKVS